VGIDRREYLRQHARNYYWVRKLRKKPMRCVTCNVRPQHNSSYCRKCKNAHAALSEYWTSKARRLRKGDL